MVYFMEWKPSFTSLSRKSEILYENGKLTATRVFWDEEGSAFGRRGY